MDAVRSDAVFDGATHTNPVVQYAKIDTAASADLVALVAGKKIRVLGLVLVVASAVTVKLQSGGATDLTGAMSLIVGVPLVLPTSPNGYLQTNSGEKLNLVLGSGVQVSGVLVYAAV